MFGHNISSNMTQRLKISANNIKKIYIKDLFTEEIKELEISMGITVKQLKKEIEKLFKLNYSLDEYTLRVQNDGMPFFKIICEDDENKTLFQNRFHSECFVIFGRENLKGGGPSYVK